MPDFYFGDSYPLVFSSDGITELPAGTSIAGITVDSVSGLSAALADLTAITEGVYTITDGAAFEIDPGNGTIQLVTLNANRTPKATYFYSGGSVTLMVDNGTAYAITWTDTTFGASGVIWVGGTAPTLATPGYSVINLWKVGTQVYGVSVGDVA